MADPGLAPARPGRSRAIFLWGGAIVVEPLPLPSVKLKRAGRAAQSLGLWNPTSQTVRIVRVDSSCECLAAVLPREGLELPAGGRAMLRVVVDLAETPHFTGGFAPTARLLDARSQAVATFTLDVEVAP